MKKPVNRVGQYSKIILVTGGCGFIGSNYLNLFVPQRPNTLFVNIDSLTYAADKENVQVSDFPNYRFEKIDIRDRKKLGLAFKKYNPSGIIHFAAESHVDVSIANPAIFVETNVVGTHNLLSLAKEFGLIRFLQVSTDEVYGSLGLKDPAFTEASSLAPNSPYAASKAAGDMLVSSYHRTFGLNMVVTRCSNNYGPNQDKSKLIPKFITNLLSGKKVPLYAAGSNVRDWIFVQDHVEAIDLVYRKGRAGEIYNIGGNCEMTNLDITRRLLALTGRSEKFIQHVKDRPGHDFRYALDYSKIKRELVWSPKVPFSEGIKRTYDHYRATASEI